MCIAVPLRVEKVGDEVVYCKVGEGTIQASLLLMDEEVKVGDYVLIHAGFAIRRLEEEDAKETLDLINKALQPG